MTPVIPFTQRSEPRPCGTLARGFRLFGSAIGSALHSPAGNPKTPSPMPNAMTAGPPEADVLVWIASGDERALGLLYDRFGAVLYAVAYRIVGQKADAEEIVMEELNAILDPAVSLTRLASTQAPEPGIQLFWNHRTNVVFLHAFHLKPAADKRVYQLWFIPKGGSRFPRCPSTRSRTVTGWSRAFQYPNPANSPRPRSRTSPRAAPRNRQLRSCWSAPSRP